MKHAAFNAELNSLQGGIFRFSLAFREVWFRGDTSFRDTLYEMSVLVGYVHSPKIFYFFCARE